MQQESRTLYAFNHTTDKLVAMVDNIQDMPVMDIIRLEKIQHMIGRHVDISKHGRAVCWRLDCRHDLGDRPGLKAGDWSDGICEIHYRQEMEIA